MTLPRMDSDPTAMDRLVSGRQVTPATTLAATEARLHATGEVATVVFDGGHPVGVVTEAAVARALADKGPETPIAMAMDYVAVPVDAQCDAYETINTFRRAAWDWLKRRQGWR
jgi:CBS domain-containing protein